MKLKNERKLLFDKVDNVNRDALEISEKLKSKDRLLLESQQERRILEKANIELRLEIEQLQEDFKEKEAKVESLEECVQEYLQNHLDNTHSHGSLFTQISELQTLKVNHMERIADLEGDNENLR